MDANTGLEEFGASGDSEEERLGTEILLGLTDITGPEAQLFTTTAPPATPADVV